MEITADYLKTIKTKEDFIQYLYSLKNNFEKKNDSWQNITIPDYFDSIAAWLEDCQQIVDDIDWAAMALVFYMGKLYE